MRTSIVRCQAAAAMGGLAAVALLTVACGPNSGSSSAASSSSASSSPAPADSAGCADAAALRATLAKIPHALSENSSSALTADLDAADTELDHLADASGNRYRTQDGGLKSALTSLQNAISADAHGTGSIISVVTAAGHVTTQAAVLLAAVGNCPSPSPSSAS